MLYDVLASFVDRKRELAHFHQMLAGKTRERVLLLLEGGETGKTCFLLKLSRECQDHSPPVPVVLLDFDPNKGGLGDPIAIGRAVRRWLGNRRTPAICKCEDQFFRRGPIVNVQTGEGDTEGVTWERRSQFPDAHVSDIAGRDSVSIGPVSVSEAGPAAGQVEWLKENLGRAMCSDLVTLARADQPVVLLIDAFEHASGENCVWLERWLFDRLHQDLPYVFVLIAGRPAQCQPFFAQLRPWGNLVAPMRFDPLSDEDILDHFRMRHIPVAKSEERLLLDLASLSPGSMALVGDMLEKRRGGAR